MKKEDYDRLVELRDTIESAMTEVEHLIRAEDHLFEQWKAGGKHVTSEFVSMYPSLPEVVEKIYIDEEELEPEES